MQVFLRKTFLFLLPLFVLFSLFGLIFIICVSPKNIDKLQKNIKTVFIGDSHIRLAINDSLLNNSANLGNHGESLYFNYFKLWSLLNENPSVDTVYLGISYHSISSNFDNYVTGNEVYYSSEIYYLLPFSEKLRLLFYKRNTLFTFMKNCIKHQTIQEFLNNKRKLSGEFANNHVNTTAVDKIMDKRLKKHYYELSEISGFSNISLEYLKKIISLCHSHQVVLIILNTPLHKYYRDAVPLKFKSKFCDIINTEHLNYIDLSELELADNAYIQDGDHVSKIGADITTNHLKSVSVQKNCSAK